jgi:hypothetical protein
MNEWLGAKRSGFDFQQDQGPGMSLFPLCPDRLLCPLPASTMGSEDLLPGVSRSEREAPSRVKIKNVCILRGVELN